MKLDCKSSGKYCDIAMHMHIVYKSCIISSLSSFISIIYIVEMAITMYATSELFDFNDFND